MAQHRDSGCGGGTDSWAGSSSPDDWRGGGMPAPSIVPQAPCAVRGHTMCIRGGMRWALGRAGHSLYIDRHAQSTIKYAVGKGVCQTQQAHTQCTTAFLGAMSGAHGCTAGRWRQNRAADVHQCTRNATTCSAPAPVAECGGAVGCRVIIGSRVCGCLALDGQMGLLIRHRGPCGGTLVSRGGV